MKNFEKLLQEVRGLAKSVTKEEFKQTLEEFNNICSKEVEDE